MDSVRPLKIKISISIDEDVVNKLRAVAEEDDRTLSSYINLILRNHLSEICTLQKMYSQICGGADDALTLLENNQIEKAKKILQTAITAAEEYYISVPDN